MGIIRSILIRLGLADLSAEADVDQRDAARDDDVGAIDGSRKDFAGDDLDIAETVAEAKELLSDNSTTRSFFDHDLLPHHYESNDHGDHANTGYAIAEFLNREPRPAAGGDDNSPHP